MARTAGKDGPSSGGQDKPSPPAQQQRIQEKYTVGGKSIRQISKEEGKARETITKIVHSADMEMQREAWAREIQREMLELAREAIPALARAVKYSKNGGKLAFDILERAGIIPPKERLCPRCRRKW